MNVLNEMTAHAEAASQRYKMLVEGWRGIYQRSLMEPDFGSMKQLSRIMGSAYAIARLYLDTEYTFIEQVSLEIALEARRKAIVDLASATALDLTDQMSDHLNESIDYLKRELAIQVERDIAFLRQSIRRTYLQVKLASDAGKISMLTSMMQYQIGNMSELHFFFHDRRNQKWPSQKFVRAVWRHHLLNLYNEATLMTISEHGVDHAQVEHVNSSAASNGMKISMFANSAYPTYSEIRSEVFHPNSDAIIRVTQDVSA